MRGWRAFLLAGWALALAAPATAADTRSAAVAAHPSCTRQGLHVDADFEQAGFAACRVTGAGDVVLTIRPEVTPINPSPWYAARLSQSVARPRQIELDYGDAKHRYRPWIAINGGAWQRLAVRADADAQGRTIIDVPAFTGQLILSAQPLRPSAAVMAAWDARVAAGQIRVETLAQSREGRAVPLYRLGPAEADRLHVFVARQHPPETTGAAAFDAFADALLEQNPAQRCPGHAFLFVPVMNPDGITRGHWRTNAGRVDLNRNWDMASEPEVAGIGSAIVKAATTAKPVTVLDFHSTRSDALYSPVAPSAVVQAFTAATAAIGLRTVPTRSAAADTLKSWAEARLGAAAFTVELADHHSPDEAETLGRNLADAFLKHLACGPAGEDL